MKNIISDYICLFEFLNLEILYKVILYFFNKCFMGKKKRGFKIIIIKKIYRFENFG